VDQSGPDLAPPPPADTAPPTAGPPALPADWIRLESLAVLHGPDLLILVDAELRAVWANGAVERVLGPGAWELVGSAVHDHVHPDDVATAVGAIAESLRTDGYHLATRVRLRRTDGSYLATRVTATTFDHTGGTWMVLSVRPVEDDLAIERRRAQLKALAQNVYLTCAGMHWYEEQDRVVPLLGSLAAVVGANSVELAASDERGDPITVRAAWSDDDGEVSATGAEVRPVAPVEQLRLAPCAVTIGAGATVEIWLDVDRDVVGFLRLGFAELSRQWDDANADVVALMCTTLVATMRRCADERRLHVAATRDPLTHLLNRTALLDRLAQVMDRDQPGYRPPVVLFADLNSFKALNDSRGHREGDTVLVTVADALRSVVRSHDLAARIGGDEFVVVFDAPGENAGELVARVRSAVDRAISEWPGLSIAVGAIAVGPFGTPEDILERADRAMYRDKATARERRPAHRPDAGGGR
jgi:diguanylate cyclase (GGDEF)-like protein/PAS domain S-box-containing protein